jgi:hypothetical protein
VTGSIFNPEAAPNTYVIIFSVITQETERQAVRYMIQYMYERFDKINALQIIYSVIFPSHEYNHMYSLMHSSDAYRIFSCERTAS